MRFHGTWLGWWCGLSLVAVGCSGTSNNSLDASPPSNGCSTTSQLKFAMKQVGLPVTMAYQSDVDGDGKKENRLATIIGTLEGLSFDMQAALNTDVQSGHFLEMADMQGGSKTDGCANMVIHTGTMPAMPPKYDGTDSFTIPSGDTPTTLGGSLASGALTTTGSKDQPPANVAQLKLMVPMQDNVRLPITVYGVQMIGAVSTSGIMNGELHGVVRKKDLDANVLPAVATALTNRINDNPTTDRTKFFIATFEDQTNSASMMKCNNTPNLCCAKNPSTCQITAAELMQNGLLQGILGPDVQMFNGDTWQPTPGGASPDSLSFGIGFNAATASF